MLLRVEPVLHEDLDEGLGCLDLGEVLRVCLGVDGLNEEGALPALLDRLLDLILDLSLFRSRLGNLILKLLFSLLCVVFDAVLKRCLHSCFKLKSHIV